MVPDYLEKSEEHILKGVSEPILKMRSRSKREIKVHERLVEELREKMQKC